MEEDLAIFRATAARFLEAEMVPNDAQWRKQQHVGKEIWRKAGALGLLCTDVSAGYGGGGGDFRHEVVLYEELARRGLSGFGQGVHSICAHYLVNHGNNEQKQRFLPRMARGELIGAIGMTEPGAGSDLQGLKTRAIRDGDDYVINGSKIFITNGFLAELIALVVKTQPGAGAKGTSIIMVETAGLEGFRVGRILDKMGMKSQDTSELFFENVRVPAANLLGGAEGQGFYQLMGDLPYERAVIAVAAVGAMEGAWLRPSSTSRTARPSARALRNSKTPSSNWPKSPARRALHECSPTTASPRSSPAASTPSPPQWPSTGSPIRSRKSSMSACSCMADTAT